MSQELPEGWALAPLGVFLEPEGLFDGPFGSNLKTSDYTEAGVRVIRLENLSNLHFIAGKRTFISHSKYADLKKHTVREGDLLVGSFVDGAVRACILPELDTPAIAKADCFCVRPCRDVINPRFLVYQLGTSRSRDALIEEIHGATRPRITTKQLRNLNILLCPYSEQQRIVAKVEALLARVNAARQRLAKVPAILKRFRRSVLAAACSGRLTSGWRGVGARDREPRQLTSRGSDGDEVPASWSENTLESLCNPRRPISYGVLKPGPYIEGGIPLLRIVDIVDGAVTAENAHRISHELSDEYRRTLLQGDELVVSLVGTIGRIGYVPRSLQGANLHRNLGLVSPGVTVTPRYLFHAMCSPLLQAQIEEVTSGANQPLFNLADLRRLAVPVPPLAEQREIVRCVEALFRLADIIEKRVAAATARAAKLTQAILAKAFRGELVPTEAELARREGRSYEPASELLQRLRTESAERHGDVPTGLGNRRVRRSRQREGETR
jgi:type I restriction enzyme, S subunit